MLAAWVEVAGTLPGDRAVLEALHDLIGTRLDDAMVAVGAVTDTGVLAVAALAVTMVLHRRGRGREAVVFAVTFVVVAVVNPALKEVFARPRPAVRPAPVDLSTYSFPSGHASASLGLVGALALVARTPRARRLALFCGAAAVVLVGFSRLAIGVHYPSDILAGWSWVGAWLVAVHARAGR